MTAEQLLRRIVLRKIIYLVLARLFASVAAFVCSTLVAINGGGWMSVALFMLGVYGWQETMSAAKYYDFVRTSMRP